MQTEPGEMHGLPSESSIEMQSFVDVVESS